MAIPAVISGLVLLVIWLGTGRSTTPVDQGQTGVAALGPEARPPDIPIASAGQVQLRLPVDPDRVTAVAFHSVDDTRSLTLQPAGPLTWHDMEDNGRQRRGGVDVGARAGTVVYSPVDGRVIAIVDPYVVRGQPLGKEYVIVPSQDSSVAVLVSHVEDALGRDGPKVGDNVRAGTTPLGQVLDASEVISQPISQFSADEGNHVAIKVTRLATG